MLKTLRRLVRKKLDSRPLNRVVVVRTVPYRVWRSDTMKPRAIWEAIESIAEGRKTIDTSAMLYSLAHVIGARETVEIGTKYGYTSVVLGIYAKEVGGTHTAVDISEDAIGQIEMFNRKLKLNIETVCENSGDVEWHRWIDLIHIDGDHSYEGCKRDISNWSKHIRQGGIIAFHDYASHRSLRDAINEEFDPEIWQMLVIKGNPGLALWSRRDDIT